MKLTKLQRHTAYIIMLSEYECKDSQKSKAFSGNFPKEMKSTDSGFCAMLDVLFGQEFYWRYEKKLLPELNAKETRKKHAWTFRNNDERVDALKKCIIETA